MTDKVAEFIERLGYEVKWDRWGVHNTIINEIKKDGKVIIDWATLNDIGLTLGYSEPRDYLPKDLIDALDREYNGFVEDTITIKEYGAVYPYLT